jgi:hypothetical protein
MGWHPARGRGDLGPCGEVLRTVAEERIEVEGRRVEVSLSPEGREVLRRAPPMAQARLIAGLRRLEPARRAALAEGLSALVRELGPGAEAAPLFFEDGHEET